MAIFAANEGVEDREPEAQSELARALLVTDGDPVRARALAEEARRGIRQQGPGEELALREREAWKISTKADSSGSAPSILIRLSLASGIAAGASCLPNISGRAI